MSYKCKPPQENAEEISKHKLEKAKNRECEELGNTDGEWDGESLGRWVRRQGRQAEPRGARVPSPHWEVVGMEEKLTGGLDFQVWDRNGKSESEGLREY